MTQQEISQPGPLLRPDGSLAAVGWARQPLLDCNLEAARFYRRFPAFQPLRIKRWDYYAITTPTHFFSFTIGDVGYLGQVFAYVIDFASGAYHEETLNLPFGGGVLLPRNSAAGESRYAGKNAEMRFWVDAQARCLSVRWPGFEGGKGLAAEVRLDTPPEHESMVIVIPIRDRRFYYNRKMNCLPASGWVDYAGTRYVLSAGQAEGFPASRAQSRPEERAAALGSLDWGRGVWEYRSFWIWASASGFLPDGRTVGLNLGTGFGDTSAATENALILAGRIHKLERVDFAYDPRHFRSPWRMTSSDGRLDLTFTPFFERVAAMDLKLLSSEVHQMFGRYTGRVASDTGEPIVLDGLVGFAEEHHAKW